MAVEPLNPKEKKENEKERLKKAYEALIQYEQARFNVIRTNNRDVIINTITMSVSTAITAAAAHTKQTLILAVGIPVLLMILIACTKQSQAMLKCETLDQILTHMHAIRMLEAMNEEEENGQSNTQERP